MTLREWVGWGLVWFALGLTGLAVIYAAGIALLGFKSTDLITVAGVREKLRQFPARARELRELFRFETLRDTAPFAAAFLIAILGIWTWGALRPWLEDWYYSWREGNPDLKVWVNANAKVYYCPGNKLFGNTMPGYFSSQWEAQKSGYRSTNWFNWGCAVPEEIQRSLPQIDLAKFEGKAVLGDDRKVVVSLKNRTDWNLSEITIWVGIGSQAPRHFRVKERIPPNADSVLEVALDTAPKSGEAWRWGIVAARGARSR